MKRVAKAAAACFAAITLLADPAYSEDQCRIVSTFSDENAPEPIHQVEFVFSGLINEHVVLSIDETPILDAVLTTEDWSVGYSGSARCLLAGRYWINLKIGEAEGNLYFDVSEETTIYLSAHRGVLEFNIWGPNPPGLY